MFCLIDLLSKYLVITARRGSWFHIKMQFYQYREPIMKRRRYHHHLTLIVGNSLLTRQRPYIEWATGICLCWSNPSHVLLTSIIDRGIRSDNYDQENHNLTPLFMLRMLSVMACLHFAFPEVSSEISITFSASFANDMCMDWKYCYWICKFVIKVRIKHIPALVEIMTWCRPGDYQISEKWWLVYWRRYASLGLNELNNNMFICIR